MAIDAPVKPPAEWFNNPMLTRPTPMTITSDGHVFGHLATWKTRHIGMQDREINPPRSSSEYSYFRTGLLSCADGREVPVGQLTLSGGHANLSASASEAARHYDDTDSAFADVAAGEDEVGIWYSGALRPGVDDLKERAIRASSLSGDWRPIGNSLELIAACAVPVPGFPIARQAIAASGGTVALVAAGTIDLWLTASGVGDYIENIERRMARIELRQRVNRTR